MVSEAQKRANARSQRSSTTVVSARFVPGNSVPRTARTTLTGAENAGRVASYERARGMGIDVRKRWLATLDERTRASHRALDGEVADADGKFPNGCEYAAEGSNLDRRFWEPGP